MFFSSALMGLCLNANLTDHKYMACARATQAALIQIGLQNNLERIEKRIQNKIENNLDSNLKFTVGTLYTLGVRKELKIRNTQMRLVDEVSASINPNSAAMFFTWRF